MPEATLAELVLAAARARTASARRDLAATIAALTDAQRLLNDAWRLVGWWQAEETRGERDRAAREDGYDA